MREALVYGTTDPEVLAKLVRGRLRAKLADLREAAPGTGWQFRGEFVVDSPYGNR